MIAVVAAPAHASPDDRPGRGEAPIAAAPAGVPSAPSAASTVPAAARPRIGLALSGGGARGFAHVGVLRALESLRVPIDCIAGTSAGSAVGAAYASGLSPDEIERALRSVDWDRDMFDDAPPRREQQPRRKSEEKAYLLDLTVGFRDGSVLLPPGLISGQKVELFLHRMLGSSTVLESFDSLPIPFRAVATDLERGEMAVQDRGSLPSAVRASMAVPSAFSPVSRDGRLLVDGGLRRGELAGLPPVLATAVGERLHGWFVDPRGRDRTFRDVRRFDEPRLDLDDAAQAVADAVADPLADPLA